MDSLHGMLRTLSANAPDKTKLASAPAPDHLTVFREFLAHLDRAQAQAQMKPTREKPTPRKTRAAGR